MSFSLQAGPAGGALAMGQGIGQAIKALALGDQVRRQAEQDSALKQSTMYANNMRGDQDAAKTELLALKLGLQRDPLKNAMIENQIPLDHQGAVQSYIDSGSFGSAYETPSVDGVGPVMPAPVNPGQMSLIARAMALANRTNMTGSHVDQMSKAAATDQEVRDRSAIINGGSALPTAQAYFATSGKAPFDNVGNTGYSLNGVDGSQAAANPVLAKLFSQVQGSLANQHNAAAGASGAAAGLSRTRAERVASGLDKPVTVVDDETGQATITALPTAGDPRTIGVAPAKGTGVDATNAKARNAVIAAVEREMSGATDAEISAEVDRRMARRTSNKSPVPSGNQPKIKLPQGVTPDAAIQQARAAIAKGKDRAAVIQRLQDMGVDTKGL